MVGNKGEGVSLGVEAVGGLRWVWWRVWWVCECVFRDTTMSCVYGCSGCVVSRMNLVF